MKERIKVAIITTDARGTSRFPIDEMPNFGTAPEALLQGFSNIKSMEVHVLSCTQTPMQSPKLIHDNIFFHSLYVPKSGWLRSGYQGCIRAVRRKLGEIKPDIVHGQGTERECAISAVLSGYPNVVTIHGNMAELARMFNAKIGTFNWLAGKLENITLPLTTGVFCNSLYTQSLVTPRTKQTWLVPNPLRVEFFVPPKRADKNQIPVLLSIGNITPRKRQLVLLDIGQKLYVRGYRFHLKFIGALGDDDYSRSFLRCIKSDAVKKFATYEGTKNTDQLIECMDRADALCHFPSEEAFGLVVAEALARNLKFFGTRLGGIIDITSGIVGAETYTIDDDEGIAVGIERWIQGGAARLDSSSDIIRERYHPEVVASKHAEIYREVLRK